MDVDPRNPDVILELHDDTLFISEDGGCSLRVLSSMDRSWDDLVRAATDPELLLATTVLANEIGVSHNDGDDWELKSVPDDVVRLASHFDDFYEMFAMAFGPPDTDVVFVGASSDIPSIRQHMKFRTTVDLEGRTATGLKVPPEVVAALGNSKRPAVRVTINGYTYRSTVAPYSGAFMLPLAAEHRTAAGVAAGDEVDVHLAIDTEPREVVAPPDFAAALEAAPVAKQFYETLSYSNKRRHVLSIEDAKTPETRQRRIDKAIDILREGRT